MLFILVAGLTTLLPAAATAWLVYRSDVHREPRSRIVLTFVYGALGAGICIFAERRVAALLGFDLDVPMSAQAGSLVFLFGVSAPLREAFKVAASWPAFRSRYFDEPYDGIVYAGVSALGFAAIEGAFYLHLYRTPWTAMRAMLALPAHLFFASTWGYALGRARVAREPGRGFGLAFVIALLCHAVYARLVYGQGQASLLAALPMLAVMGGVTRLFVHDLRARSREPHAIGLPRSRLAVALDPDEERAMLAAVLRRPSKAVRWRWVLAGAFVTLGAVLFAFLVTVVAARLAHIDFAAVDESDIATTGPIALLGSGLLSAFPLSGFVLARASETGNVQEPAMASALAIGIVLFAFGIAVPIAVLFAVAVAPVAWLLACLGAWVGRSGEGSQGR